MSAIVPQNIGVIIDDGHGMETPGKRTPLFKDGTHIKENEFNHATKVLLMESLKTQGFGVYDVSPERTDTPLNVRTTRANAYQQLNKYKVYIYISIHFNAIGDYWNDNVGGIETYYHPNSTNGKKLATIVHKWLLKGTNLKDRKVQSANFHVLRETNKYITAILLECGFMSNSIEAQLMKNLAYQQECTIEVTKGVCEYFNIPYKEPINDLEKYTRHISPQYYSVWLKHFEANKHLNWEGLLYQALVKNLP